MQGSLINETLSYPVSPDPCTVSPLCNEEIGQVDGISPTLRWLVYTIAIPVSWAALYLMSFRAWEHMSDGFLKFDFSIISKLLAAIALLLRAVQ